MEYGVSPACAPTALPLPPDWEGSSRVTATTCLLEKRAVRGPLDSNVCLVKDFLKASPDLGQHPDAIVASAVSIFRRDERRARAVFVKQAGNGLW